MQLSVLTNDCLLRYPIFILLTLLLRLLLLLQLSVAFLTLHSWFTLSLHSQFPRRSLFAFAFARPLLFPRSRSARALSFGLQPSLFSSFPSLLGPRVLSLGLQFSCQTSALPWALALSDALVRLPALSLVLRRFRLDSSLPGPPALSLVLGAIFSTHLFVNRTVLLPLLHNSKGQVILSLHKAFISFFPLGLSSPWAFGAVSWAQLFHSNSLSIFFCSSIKSSSSTGKMSMLGHLLVSPD